MKLIDVPYKIECACCKKMSKNFVISDNDMVCLYCYNKGKLSTKKVYKKKIVNKYPPLNPPKKRYKAKRCLMDIQKETIKKNLEEYYKMKIPIKILYGGCFK